MRNLNELPELWHGAYVEYNNGSIFLFGKNGEAHLFSDADELWLKLIEISTAAGAVRPSARIPVFSPTKTRRETMEELVQKYRKAGGKVKKIASMTKRTTKPLALSLADLNLEV